MSDRREREGPPAWLGKHPCTACKMGYGNCAQFLSVSMKCCAGCEHPGRWAGDPWTADDLREMWEGKEMPAAVRQSLKRLDPDYREEWRP